MRNLSQIKRQLTVKDGWLLCPTCGKSKVLRIWPESKGQAIQVFCKKCGQETLVDIDKCQCHKCQCR